MRLALVLLVLALTASTLAAKKKPNKKPGKKPGAIQKGKCTNTFTMNPKAAMFNKWTKTRVPGKNKSKY